MFDIPRTVNGSTCLENKLLKRQLIKERFDKNLPVYEDALFLLQYCHNIKKAVVIPQCYYNYYHRSNSLSHNNVLNNSKFINIRRTFINIAQEIGRECARNAEADYLDACWRLYNLARNSQDEKTRLRLEHELLDYLGAQKRGVIINLYLSWKLKLLILAWFVIYSKRSNH